MNNTQVATIALKFTNPGGSPVAAPTGGTVTIASAAGQVNGAGSPPTPSQLTAVLGSDNQTVTLTPVNGADYTGIFFLVYSNAATNPTSVQEQVNVVNGIDVGWNEASFTEG